MEFMYQGDFELFIVSFSFYWTFEFKSISRALLSGHIFASVTRL